MKTQISLEINFCTCMMKNTLQEAGISMQFHPNYQVLLKESQDTPSSEAGAKEYLNRWGLNPKFTFKNAKKFICSTEKRDFTISLKEPLPLNSILYFNYFSQNRPETLRQ